MNPESMLPWKEASLGMNSVIGKSVLNKSGCLRKDSWNLGEDYPSEEHIFWMGGSPTRSPRLLRDLEHFQEMPIEILVTRKKPI